MYGITVSRSRKRAAYSYRLYLFGRFCYSGICAYEFIETYRAVSSARRGQTDAVVAREFFIQICRGAPDSKNFAYVARRSNERKVVRYRVFYARIRRARDVAFRYHVPERDAPASHEFFAFLCPYGERRSEHFGKNAPKPILRVTVIEPDFTGFRRRHTAEDEYAAVVIEHRLERMENFFVLHTEIIILRMTQSQVFDRFFLYLKLRFVIE